MHIPLWLWFSRPVYAFEPYSYNQQLSTSPPARKVQQAANQYAPDGRHWSKGRGFVLTIPDWDDNKVLPPIHPDAPEGKEFDSLYRSPYVAKLVDFVTRFATTPERAELMEKFLDYRAALHQSDISEGFQWINGSFVENIERSSKPHSPKDIDVVTFFFGNENNARHRELLDPRITEPNFDVDGYGIELGKPLTVATAVEIGFWHDLWSHRIDHVWKGFIQIDLDPEEDPPARHRLHAIKEDLYEK